MPTKQAVKHTIDEVTGTYPVYRIKIDELFYNNQNDRIATWISKYRSDHGGSDPWRDLPQEEYNAVIEGFIVQSNPEAIRSTQRNIAAFGQRVPGVVLDNGLVIDGNRRLTCIRRNAAANHTVGWFEAVILPDEIASDPKRIKMLELSIQHGEEGKVDYDPIERLVGIYNDIIKNGLLTSAEYARYAGIKESDVAKLIEQAEFMHDFLDFCNAPEQYHLARELAIAGPLGEMAAILKKCKSENDRQQVKEYIFANIVAQPEGDITRFIRKFKRVVGTELSRDFYGDEQTAFQRLLPAMGTEPLTVDKVRTIRSDDRITDPFRRAMERAGQRERIDRISSAPLVKSRGAVDSLRQIVPSMLRNMSMSDRADVRHTLTLVADEAQRLIEEIDRLA